MNKQLLIFFFLFFCSALCAQENSQRILYIVDSLIIVDDPDENDQLTENDIEKLEIVTNLDRIKAAGYEGKMDKIIYVITKSYATILAAKDNVPIPPEDLIKICADLNLGYELGDRSPMLLDTKNRYCK